MQISLLCVGRLRLQPEGQLAREYAQRASLVGRAVGLTPVQVIEITGRKADRASEGDAILGRLGSGDLIALDERGEPMASRRFAALLADRRSLGAQTLSFAVGGAEGLDERVLDRAVQRLSLGPMTWPHALARVLLAEQIYRAATILAGGPYHRG